MLYSSDLDFFDLLLVQQSICFHEENCVHFGSIPFISINFSVQFQSSNIWEVSESIQILLLKLFVSKGVSCSIYLLLTKFTSATSKLLEILDDFTKSQLDRQKKQLSRFSNLKHFGSLSSKVDALASASSRPGHSKKRPVVDKKNKVSSIPEAAESNAQMKTDLKRRDIKKPTIVGKSVKGSAAQAMIQHRARARTTRTPSAKVIGGSSTSSQRQQPQRHKKTSASFQSEKDKKNRTKYFYLKEIDCQSMKLL